MNEVERIAILETRVNSMDKLVYDLVKEMKALQNRWALIIGGLAVIMNLPTLFQILRLP